jgi:hypothetical protein
MIYGSALGSFAVENFSIDRLRNLTTSEVHDRVRTFRELTAFDHLAYVPASSTS